MNVVELDVLIKEETHYDRANNPRHTLCRRLELYIHVGRLYYLSCGQSPTGAIKKAIENTGTEPRRVKEMDNCSHLVLIVFKYHCSLQCIECVGFGRSLS